MPQASFLPRAVALLAAAVLTLTACSGTGDSAKADPSGLRDEAHSAAVGRSLALQLCVR